MRQYPIFCLKMHMCNYDTFRCMLLQHIMLKFYVFYGINLAFSMTDADAKSEKGGEDSIVLKMRLN